MEEAEEVVIRDASACIGGAFGEIVSGGDAVGAQHWFDSVFWPSTIHAELLAELLCARQRGVCDFLTRASTTRGVFPEAPPPVPLRLVRKWT